MKIRDHGFGRISLAFDVRAIAPSIHTSILTHLDGRFSEAFYVIYAFTVFPSRRVVFSDTAFIRLSNDFLGLQTAERILASSHLMDPTPLHSYRTRSGYVSELHGSLFRLPP